MSQAGQRETTDRIVLVRSDKLRNGGGRDEKISEGEPLHKHQAFLCGILAD